MKFQLVQREKANHSVVRLCKVLGVSTSGYWAWRKRPPSDRELGDRELYAKIADIYRQIRDTYGVPRMYDELVDQGIRCGRKRIARLMRANALVGCHRRRRSPVTTRPATQSSIAAPDLVNRQFHPDAPNRLWLADITYVRTWVGFLYLAVVIDAYSRRVIGWHMADHLRTELVVQALEMALWNRRPDGAVILHSDRGSQYTSVVYGQRCRQAGVVPSMGSVGDAYDNAMCESFFATLECELLDRETFRNRSEAKLAIFDYIEIFYNRWRRHTGIGSVAPVAYEAAYGEAQASEPHTIPNLGGTSPQTPHLLSHASAETMAGQP